jgi:hypothetical protein
LKTLVEIKHEVDRLARVIDASGHCALPTYGRSEDCARPHIEIDQRGYHFVVVERGQELSRFTTADSNDLLYRIFETVTFSIACDYELANRINTQDSRRLLFHRQVSLLSKLSEDWGQRCAHRLELILEEHPFNDGIANQPES